MYTDMRDFDPEFIWQFDSEDSETGKYIELWIEIEKRGGGTVGQDYEGWWSYRVWGSPGRAGEPLLAGIDLHTPMPHNHLHAARIVCDFFEAGYRGGPK